MAKKIQSIKAWAVIKNGKIVCDDFFTRDNGKKDKPLLAVFPYKRIDKYSPLWGYSVGKEKIVPCEIIIKSAK